MGIVINIEMSRFFNLEFNVFFMYNVFNCFILDICFLLKYLIDGFNCLLGRKYSMIINYL